MTPVLAVIGFVNMGKSSLVATLTETDVVAIDATAGTTTRCQRFACVAEGQTVLELVDTPGFQSARRALRWLEDWLDERGEESATGPDAVRAFLEANRASAVFANELELLAPPMDGAGVLYLVDASLPYKAKYEAEMRILAMTGRPRMGVINLHGEAEHRDAWRQALSANFAKVVELDVTTATPAERRAVLRSFAGIDDDWAPAFERAARLLEDEDRVRRRKVASHLRELVAECLTRVARAPYDGDQDKARLEAELRRKLKGQLAASEQRCRRAVEAELGFRIDVSAQPVDLPGIPDRLEDLRTLPGPELEGRPQGLEGQEDVGEDDPRVHPELLEGADRERAKLLAEQVVDPSELLWSIRDEERFDTSFRSTPGDKVAYHAPCHLRAQAVGFKGRDLLRKIPGVKPVLTMECCGHDGTYAMKLEGFEPAQRAGRKAFEGMADADAEVWATDCPLAAIQFQQFAGRKPMHPMSILARAYRADGFPRSLEEPEESQKSQKSQNSEGGGETS